MKEIDIKNLSIKAVDLWENQWLLLTAGNISDYNMMTVAWGSIGYMWSKPFAQIVVRPQRHTYRYMEKYDTFTLCAFPPRYHNDLKILGTLSGKDGNKIDKTSLTIKQSLTVEAPSYNEANLILECKKIYFQDMNPAGFLDGTIVNNYPKKDFHRIYFGEILKALTQ